MKFIEWKGGRAAPEASPRKRKFTPHSTNATQPIAGLPAPVAIGVLLCWFPLACRAIRLVFRWLAARFL
eukprot:UN12174